jgi:hypothetical protein
MDAAAWGFVGTIAGAIVGSLASVLTTFLTGANTRKLQSHSDSLLRLERFREFQRTTLLELQEALALNMRLVGRGHLEDLDSYHKNPQPTAWPKLSDALDQEIAQSNRRLSLLMERIANDDLRKLIKDLRPMMSDVLMARSAEESRVRFMATMAPFEKVMEELGTVLRSYY